MILLELYKLSGVGGEIRSSMSAVATLRVAPRMIASCGRIGVKKLNPTGFRPYALVREELSVTGSSQELAMSGRSIVSGSSPSGVNVLRSL